MFVTLSNIKDLKVNKVAFNAVTGVILSDKKQAVLKAACEACSYQWNAWATPRQWDSLGLSIKGAKGKGICLKSFIPENVENGARNIEYEQALKSWLKIKEHNEKGGRKTFNPFVKTKGGFIVNSYYYNVAEVRRCDGSNEPVDLNIPAQLCEQNCNTLSLAYASETADIEYLPADDKDIKESKETKDIPEAKIVEISDNLKPDLNLLKELETLRAENKALREKLENLQATTAVNTTEILILLKELEQAVIDSNK